MGLQWMPGKIIQISNPYTIVCFWFCDNSVSQISKSQLCSFLNYGSKVDFEAVEFDEAYRQGIITAVSNFAEVYRPDLLQHEDVNTMLLDWARLGFVGCALMIRKSNDNGKKKKTPSEKAVISGDSKPGSSSQSSGPELSDECLLDQSKNRKRKLSLRTEDSGYNSPSLSVHSFHSPSGTEQPAATKQSEVDKFVLGNLPYYGWWPGRVSRLYNTFCF